MLKKKLNIVINYIKFRWLSGNEHGLHSPFVYSLYTEAIRQKGEYYIFEEIERLRYHLLESKEYIEVTDYGAGSVLGNKKRKRIKDIAKHSEKPAYLAQALFRIVNYLRPQVILELGTSFGLTTLYLAGAKKSSNIITFEGCNSIAAIAKANFRSLNFNSIVLVEGNLDITLNEQLALLKKLDFVFFDANHRYQPTINYFLACLGKAHEETVFIFDDIYWSDEMVKAWNEIKDHPEVTLTIDLFYFGIVFFRKKQPKQHFKLRI